MGCIHACLNFDRGTLYHRRSSLNERELVKINCQQSVFSQLPVFVPRLLSPFLQAREMCACETASKHWYAQFVLLWQHMAEERWGNNAVARFIEGPSHESTMADILPPRQPSLTRKNSSWKQAYLEMDQRIWSPDTELGPNLVCGN